MTVCKWVHGQFTNRKTLTAMTREEKIDRYIESVVQGMDWKTMYHYVYESIEEDLKDSTDEQIDEMYNYHFEDNDEETTT